MMLPTYLASSRPSTRQLATRLQMFGRINRVVQERDSVENVVVTAGVLESKLHANYEMAKTVFKCLHTKKVKKSL